MDPFQKIQSYQARRGNIFKLLEEYGSLTIEGMKEAYEKRFNECMPFCDDDDESIHSWLSQIENVGFNVKRNLRFYYAKKVYDFKRRTSSPIGGRYQSNGYKRSRSAPDNDDEKNKNNNNNGYNNYVRPTLKFGNNNNGARPSRQDRSVKFVNPNQYNFHDKNVKTRSKSESRNAILGMPNMYGTILISDDFFLGIAQHILNYRLSKINGILQCGMCVSGLTISEASNKIEELNDHRNKTALVYLGSIDIAMDKQSIELIQDLSEFVFKCHRLDIRPILCTLAPMPNFIHGNRLTALKNFNDFIRNKKLGCTVIDLNLGFMKNKKSIDYLDNYYQNAPHKVSGYKKPLLLWSQDGTKRAYDVLQKNLGDAITSDEPIVCDYC